MLWRLNKEELITFAKEHLRLLLNYDEKNNSKWVETLGIYLKNNSGLQESAKELHIHPNTMSYRIKRIQEILGIDLHKFENKLNLAISYKIYKHIANKFK
ncbi:MAG: helix-turn-helix domain-containing protein [Halanaerobiales bacterium]|nr:helix-turn-helix domain-containing protein [Halanaerobiales bacterium]